jgi:hypothetical protein
MSQRIPERKKSPTGGGLLASLLIATLALSALRVVAQTLPITLDQTAKKQELLGKMQTELTRVDDMQKGAANVAAYAAWQPVASKKQANATLLADRRNDFKKQVTVAMLEADLAAFAADTATAGGIAKSAAQFAEARVPLTDYTKTHRQLVDGIQLQRAQDLRKQCDQAVDALAFSTRANADVLAKTATETYAIAPDCVRLPKEFAALNAKVKEFDGLVDVIPGYVRQHPVLSAIAAFADLQAKHAALRTRVEGIRAQATSGTALDEPIGLLNAYNRDARSYAEEAARGGDARTVNVLNTLERGATVFWRAAGCAGTLSGQTFVCHSESVVAGRSVGYQFKAGTSARKVGFMASGCATQETSIAKDAAGADLHVITDGCQIKPESVALAESVQKRTKYVKNLRDKPIQVVFMASGCAGTHQGKTFVCAPMTVGPGTEVKHEFPLGTSDLGMDWGDNTCSIAQGRPDSNYRFGNFRGRQVIPARCEPTSY